MRILICLSLALFAGAGCGAVAAGEGQPGASGTLSGMVTISPCRPVERPGDPPCPPRPGIAVHFQPTAGGATVTAVTDGAGTYRVLLPPGEYDATAEGGIGRGQPHRVAVVRGGTVVLDFVVDSGIR